MRPLFSHRRRVSAAIVVASLVSGTAFAQTTQPSFLGAAQAAVSQVPAQAAPAAPSGPVRRLSIDEATKLSLEQNLGIRIQRVDPQIQDLSVAQARASWAPTLTTQFNRNSATTQSTNAFSATNNAGTFSNGVGLNQVLRTGGSYVVNWFSSRVATNDPTATFAPQLGSRLDMQLSQPLMRNFSMDQVRQQVKTSQKLRELSDIQLQSVVTQTLRNVRNAYWDLTYAINSLKAQQQSLALSQQSLRDNQKKVEIGTMAPIDIVQAQAEVAANEQGVIVAEASIKSAQDNLRTLILDPGTPDFWTVEFEPTDAPQFDAQAIDVDAAVRNALDKRADLLQAKNSLAQSDINIQYFRNQILPDVNANVRYISSATGGVQLSPLRSLDDLINGVPRSVVADRGFGNVLGDLFGATYPNWTVGVSIGYPLGTSIPKANLARARLQYEQSQTQLKNLEMQVATQVRLVARNVNTNQQRVRSARASRELQEKKLEAEEKKLAAGMSSSFFVFQAQRDLSVARVAEIQAISDYNKSLVDFEAVQMVPLGGGGGFITVAGR